MINEERVRLMTKLAVYEKNEGKQDERIDNYFKTDFLSAEFLKSFLCATISFVILAGIYAFYNFETLMLALYSMDVFSFVKNIILIYLLFLVAFLVITFIIYSARYNQTKESLRGYYKNLRALSESYEREED